MNARRNRHTEGLTLFEVIIAFAVIAVLLAVAIPYLRERERARLQALADDDPENVFSIRAWAVKDRFERYADVAGFCEIANPTDYPLAFHWRAEAVSQFPVLRRTQLAWVPDPLRPPVTPGESLSSRKYLIPARSRVLYRLNPSGGGEFPIFLVTASFSVRMEMALLSADEAKYWTQADGGRFEVTFIKTGTLSEFLGDGPGSAKPLRLSPRAAR